MESEAIIAGLLALALGFIKVLEVFGTWFVKKLGPTKEKSDKVVVVQLDPEVSRMIRDTHDRVHSMHDILTVKDHDGTPLVYSSRSMAENVSVVAAAARDISSSQERIVEILEKIDDNVDENGDALRQVIKNTTK